MGEIIKKADNAQATFDFSKGARDVILSDFPEVQDFQGSKKRLRRLFPSLYLF